jgi:hypothetical protein
MSAEAATHSAVSADDRRRWLALAAVGAVIAALLIEPQPAQAEPKTEVAEPQVAVASQYTPVCHETTTATVPGTAA